ncbi:MAG: EamA family transporter [Bacteroidota bacterium]
MRTLTPLNKAYLMMHIAIVLYGFTAILGKLIELPGITIVVYRMGITLLSLLFIPGAVKVALGLPAKTRWKIAFIGLLMAIHWVSFFQAIKLSNVSITLSCLASTALFTSLFEPLFFRRRIQWYEILLAAMVIVGFLFIFDVAGERYWLGMLVSVVSAITIALASVINKAVVDEVENVFSITLIEFVAGVAILLLVFPIYVQFFPETPIVPQSGMDWLYLIILALLCTTLAYSLTMMALRHVSAYTTTLSINLEPIYGMLMAAFFFQENEELGWRFYIGAAIILASVVLHPVLKRLGKGEG